MLKREINREFEGLLIRDVDHRTWIWSELDLISEDNDDASRKWPRENFLSYVIVNKTAGIS
jgi:hypothetical protein